MGSTSVASVAASGVLLAASGVECDSSLFSFEIAASTKLLTSDGARTKTSVSLIKQVAHVRQNNTKRSACKAGLLMLRMSVKLTRVTRVVLPNNLHETTKSATRGEYHFNHSKLGFIFSLNATEHAQFHAVFQCKDQNYTFVIHPMCDPCMQFLLKMCFGKESKLQTYLFSEIFNLLTKSTQIAPTAGPNDLTQGNQHSPRFL